MARRYNIIYADPPWKYNLRKKSNTKFGLGMSRYNGLTEQELCALDIPSIAADNCVLFIWSVAPKLHQLFPILDAWGFRYITKAFSWIKIDRKGNPRFLPGYYTGSNSEDCYLASRGRIPVKDNSVKQIILQELGEHSQKPNEVRTRIVRLFGDLPRIELFAREKKQGWDVWGDEVVSDIELIFRSAEEMLYCPEAMTKAALKKFQRGKREHGNDWELVDHKKELLEECLDGFNYLQGAKNYNNISECVEIQKFFVATWDMAKQLNPNPLNNGGSIQ